MTAWKQDAGKPRIDLVPHELVQGAADVLTFGAGKYGPRNWERGMDWGRVFGALQRHLWAFWAGEDRDQETGLPHTHHAACCIAFLMAYEARQVGNDDRPKRTIPTLPREGLPFEVVKAERDAAREAALTEMARLGQEFDAPPQPIGEPHSAMTASGYAGVATRDATAWAAQISGGEDE